MHVLATDFCGRDKLFNAETCGVNIDGIVHHVFKKCIFDIYFALGIGEVSGIRGDGVDAFGRFTFCFILYCSTAEDGYIFRSLSEKSHALTIEKKDFFQHGVLSPINNHCWMWARPCA